MAVSISVAAFDEPLRERLAVPAPPGVTLYWLGQAGFIVRTASRVLAIDPYLSDSLALKYRGQLFPHERMAPPPIAAGEIADVDLVLCTHHHTDHMDPQTLRPLAEANPDARFVVPAARLDESQARTGVAGERLIALDAGENWEPFDGVRIHAIPAAHESLRKDAAGHLEFLGYVLELGDVRILHSGDTVPFAGQDDWVKSFAPDLALLPVNGRSEHLRANGVPGNMTLDEAVALCDRCAIPAMIAQHHGMFEFNTLSAERIDRVADEARTPIRLLRARYQEEYQLVNM